MPSPLILVLLGVNAIAFAPVLAKLAIDLDHASGGTLNPFGTAFWRTTFGIPVFYLLWKRQAPPPTPFRFQPVLLLPGAFFALDLGFWHSSFEYTSVANSTVIANLAALIVGGYSWKYLGEKLTRSYGVGLQLALVGIYFLVGANFTPDGAYGDFLAVVTAATYAGYLISMKRLSTSWSVSYLMMWNLICASTLLALFGILSPGSLVPDSAEVWLCLLALTLICQVGGQGLIIKGMSLVPASLASLLLPLQPLLTAIWGFFILGQSMSSIQLCGALLMVAGVMMARRGVTDGSS